MHDRWYEKATARCFGWLEYGLLDMDLCLIGAMNGPLEAGARTQEALGGCSQALGSPRRLSSGLRRPQEAKTRPQEVLEGRSQVLGGPGRSQEAAAKPWQVKFRPQ